MKKILCVVMAVVLCVMSLGSVAVASEEKEIVETKGMLTLRGGMTFVSGNTYTIWAQCNAVQFEDLFVSVILYKVVDGQELIMTGASNSGYDLSCTAQKNVVITRGYTYVVRLYCKGNTQQLLGSATYNL